MDIISIAITVVLAVLMLWLAIRLPYAIARNLRDGFKFRRSLAHSLDDLRLSRMLTFLGIAKNDYLHRTPALDVKHHMTRCDACDSKDTCDETLEKDPTDESTDLGFCANIDDLKEIRKSR